MLTGKIITRGLVEYGGTRYRYDAASVPDVEPGDVVEIQLALSSLGRRITHVNGKPAGLTAAELLELRTGE